MTDSADGPTPPTGLPDELVSDLEELTSEELRNAIIHARELLHAQEENTGPIEPSPNEDILRVTEHEGYTEVVKQFDCAQGCSECPHGPYLYHVTEEPRPDGSHHTHWSFIGRIDPDEV
jgi:hypothetical protein